MPSVKSRAYVIVHVVDIPAGMSAQETAYAFVVSEPPAALGAVFGRGQLDASAHPNRLVFNGYIEFAQQQTQFRVQAWLPKADFVATAIDQREVHVAACTNAERRFSLEEDEGHPFVARYAEAPSTTHGDYVRWSLGSGARPKAGNPGGKWMDVMNPGGNSAKMQRVVELLKQHGPRFGPEAVAKEDPGLYMRNFNGIARLAEVLAPKTRDLDFEPRPWQEAFLAILKGDPHPRHIHWVADPAGGTGKSMLSTNICCEHDGIVMQGKVSDMAFAYNGQKVVIFDFARPVSLSECRDCFELAEGFKNKQIFSGKYHSGMKKIDMVHVVFFSNSKPPDGIWTEDRLQLFELSRAPAFKTLSAFGGAPEPEPEDILDHAIAEMKRLARVTHALRDARLAKEAAAAAAGGGGGGGGSGGTVAPRGEHSLKRSLPSESGDEDEHGDGY